MHGYKKKYKDSISSEYITTKTISLTKSPESLNKKIGKGSDKPQKTDSRFGA